MPGSRNWETAHRLSMGKEDCPSAFVLKARKLLLDMEHRKNSKLDECFAEKQQAVQPCGIQQCEHKTETRAKKNVRRRNSIDVRYSISHCLFPPIGEKQTSQEVHKSLNVNHHHASVLGVMQSQFTTTDKHRRQSLDIRELGQMLLSDKEEAETQHSQESFCTQPGRRHSVDINAVARRDDFDRNSNEKRRASSGEESLESGGEWLDRQGASSRLTSLDSNGVPSRSSLDSDYASCMRHPLDFAQQSGIIAKESNKKPAIFHRRASLSRGDLRDKQSASSRQSSFENNNNSCRRLSLDLAHQIGITPKEVSKEPAMFHRRASLSRGDLLDKQSASSNGASSRRSSLDCSSRRVSLDLAHHNGTTAQESSKEPVMLHRRASLPVDIEKFVPCEQEDKTEPCRHTDRRLKIRRNSALQLNLFLAEARQSLSTQVLLQIDKMRKAKTTDDLHVTQKECENQSDSE